MKKQGKKWMLVALALLAVVTVALPLVGCKNDTVAEQTGDGTGSGDGNQGSGSGNQGSGSGNQGTGDGTGSGDGNQGTGDGTGSGDGNQGTGDGTGSGSGNQGSGDPEQPVTYTVSFDTNGGGSIVSQTIVNGQTATKPADPTLENNVFYGWYSDKELTSEYDFTTPVTGSFTLYAKWVEGTEVTANNVSSVIAGLTGEEPHTLVVTGELNDLSAITTALSSNNSAKVNLDLSKATRLTSIGKAAFFGCDSLTSISIPSSVTSIGEGAFDRCSGLTSISIPSSVTSIGKGAFFNCYSLTSIDLSKATGLTSIGEDAFSGCYSLTSIDLSKATGLTSIDDHAFSGYSVLTSISIPSSVTSIGNYAFYGCSGLTSISIPSSVTSIGEAAFSGCSSLNISVKENNTKYSSVDGMLLNKEKTILIAYPSAKETVPNVPTSVTTIGNYAFYGCSGLTSISIPSSVTSIGEAAFDSCSGLTSISIPEGVKIIADSAFSGCSGLTSIDLSKATGLTTIGNNAFYDCNSLTSISIPSSVTSIGETAFYECSSLEEVTMEANTPPELGIWAFNGTADTLQILVPNEDNYTNEAAKEKGWEPYKDKIIEQTS